jgi:hypothetical protein
VRKLRRVFTRTYFVRFFEPSDRLEAEKSRIISLCAIVCKISLSFRTASVDSGLPITSRSGLKRWTSSRYRQLASGGIEDRIDAMFPPVFKPKRVPRS